MKTVEKKVATQESPLSYEKKKSGIGQERTAERTDRSEFRNTNPHGRCFRQNQPD
jgi:hypothetical protein